MPHIHVAEIDDYIIWGKIFDKHTTNYWNDAFDYSTNIQINESQYFNDPLLNNIVFLRVSGTNSTAFSPFCFRNRHVSYPYFNIMYRDR